MMVRRLFIGGGLAALLAFVGGVSLVEASEPAGGAGGSQPVTHTVEIRDFRFHPAEIRVKRGDTIIWVNHDLAPHTATASTKGWDSGRLANGQSWSEAMTDAGRIAYICAYHPAMKGVVIVEPADGAP